MSVSKAQVIEILRAREDHDLADRVNAELPAELDPEQHQELFRGLELDVEGASHRAVTRVNGGDAGQPMRT